MAKVGTHPALRIGTVGTCALGAMLAFEIGAPLGVARAAEAAAGAAPQQPGDLTPAPTTPDASGLTSTSDAPSSSAWAPVPGWQKAVGVGATLVGLAAVASGAYLVWYTCNSDSSSCLYPHKTAPAGWLLIAGGAAATLGGVTLVLVPIGGKSAGHAVAGLAMSGAY